MLACPRLIFVAASLLALARAPASQCVATSDGSGIACQTLYAGQTINAGSVCVEVVGTNLVVSYNTTGGWQLVETHVWVGVNLSDMPQTRTGNPKVGNFPYHSGDISGATSWSHTIPLMNLNFSCPDDPTMFYVAAHAALRKSDGTGGYQTETGWSDGDRFVTKGNWGTYTPIRLTCDCTTTEPELDRCETAFAFGGAYATCFESIDEDGDGKDDFNRWGWTNGALAAGTYSFDVYAGAGQCDLTKGTFVGHLQVTYDGATASVTFSTQAPFYLEETHLYVGNEILARDVNNEYTVAPGQYPYIHDVVKGTVSDAYTVTGLSGSIYVVAHSVVCAPTSGW